MEQIVITAILVAIGFYWGRSNEAQHLESLKKRERKYKSIVTTGLKAPPQNLVISSSNLVQGSTVVSVDYFKQFMATIKLILGGRLTTYESLIQRARREAILRMKESAKGHDMIINVKIETSSISKGAGKSIGSIEVLAYGTAIKSQS
jgi:uncharacterized protein YbjQ (UPF0145 family)